MTSDARPPRAGMAVFAPMTDIVAAVHARAHVRLFMNEGLERNREEEDHPYGIGGPVGSGKTALVEAITPILWRAAQRCSS